VFWKSVTNNIIFFVGTVFIQAGLGFLLAVLLKMKLPGSNLFKAVYFMPIAMATSIITAVFKIIMDPTNGALNQFLRAIHLDGLAMSWLGDTKIALFSVIVVNIFQWMGFSMITYYASLMSLPDDVYEAAQLDYCGPVKYFFTMVLPMSKTVVATVSVFTFLNVWNDYLWPSLVFTSSDLLTAQIGLNSITSNDNTTMVQTLAVITLVTIPVIIIYSLFSRQIVEGVTSTGSKEG